MLRTTLAIGAALLTAGCMEGPQNADDFKSAASRSSFAKSTTITIPRSIGAVNASLSTGARKCLNRSVTTRSSTPGTYGPVVSVITTKYTTDFQASGSAGEMSMYREIVGKSFLPQPKGVAYVVESRSNGGSTNLTIYGGKWGYKSIDNAVKQWAKGGTIVCPDLPGS